MRRAPPSPAHGARGRAIDALVAVEEGAPGQAAIAAQLDSEPPLADKDRGLATELFYGTLRLERRLDAWLEAASDRGLRDLDISTLVALRIGAYQLAALDRVPDFAALAATVQAAKGRAPAGRIGFVNAVLRRLARERPWEQQAEAVLPPWQRRIVQRWAERCGVEAEALLAEHERAPPVHVHVIAGARQDAASRWAEDGVEVAAVGSLPGVYEILAGPFFNGALARDAAAIAQDAASAAIAEWVGAGPGLHVLDACAGRGGKALFLAASGAEVTATDLAAEKLALAAALAERAGAPLAATAALAVDDADAMAAVPGPIEGFDLALVDAPCSGLGTLRRRPEIGRRRTMADVLRLAGLQRAILESVAARVRPGGALVYAVCTLTEEESVGVVAPFLAAHPDWQIDRARPAWLDGWIGDDGALRSHPLLHGADCFYAVRLIRATQSA